MNAPFDLTGHAALVTGSTRGIGKAIVRALARAGATVVVSSRKADACETVAGEIRADRGAAEAIPCNMSDMAQVDALADACLQRVGAITILVCNAATNPIYGPMAAVEDRAFEKIMATNVGGNIRLINRLAPAMGQRGGGSIILLSSIAGLVGSRNIGAYAVSKTADIQLARNYAVELGGHNIRVNAIAPGLIATDFATALWQGEAGQAFAARTPLKRLGEPEDIAGVALFLASDASRFVTGQCIVADGGVTIADPF
jgi:NAD(P)-dependent dehydrogenase (short-subunit alcohol dehydrogenase family)